MLTVDKSLLFHQVNRHSINIMDKSMLNWLSDDVNSGYYYNADKLVNSPLQLIMGTLIAESVVLIFETIGVKKELSMRRLIGSHVSYLIFGGIMYVVVYVVSNSNIVSVNGVIKLCVQVGVGACTYLTLCLLYWTINKKSIFNRYIPAK